MSKSENDDFFEDNITKESEKRWTANSLHINRENQGILKQRREHTQMPTADSKIYDNPVVASHKYLSMELEEGRITTPVLSARR